MKKYFVILTTILISGCINLPQNAIPYEGKEQSLQIVLPALPEDAIVDNSVQNNEKNIETRNQQPEIVSKPVVNRSELPIVTVFDFSYEGVSAMESEFLVDFLGGALFDTNKFRIIDRTQREQILAEIEFSLSGCTDENCQLEAGKLIAADYMVVGSLGKMGSRYIINAKLIEIETGETVTSARDIYNDMDMMVEGCEKIAIDLTSM